MIYNISMLKDWLRCPQMAYNIHTKRRVRPPSPELEVGTLFHEMMENKLDRKLVPGLLKSWDMVSQDSRDLWLKYKLWIPIQYWHVPEQYNILAKEIALKGEL